MSNSSCDFTVWNKLTKDTELFWKRHQRRHICLYCCTLQSCAFMLEWWRVWVRARLLSHTRRKGLCFMLPVMHFPDLWLICWSEPSVSLQAQVRHDCKLGFPGKSGFSHRGFCIHYKNKRILRIIRLIFSCSHIHVRRKFLLHCTLYLFFFNLSSRFVLI